ncbi:uncharacterized protein SPPG_04075 [Spizellomyces punctatus DAOM BR117]|uniref:DNA repair protein XRCC4 n=1 Tax=Spizellomyces punctatus (strain DAOM BR117) TaxID=645134 RepID=A0A0L0HIP0_SPIPD|nr:uncharacterized protein SPPG_04075 [Spizellomyces punctatus DAOM BR117]KND00977.1 hypothetical protein SPPG_04075 [Spizellomyces punctatus DAOM BR117]|eukprot:XP_016609016.1 hypothetical protein SPPG_04075 [Spizellomyces punctatus DAOM BR117]
MSTNRTFCRIAPRPDYNSLSSSLSLSQSGQETTLYVSCDWNSVNSASRSTAVAFELGITDGTIVWQRAVTMADLRRCQPEDISEDDYLMATKAAFAGQSDHKGQKTGCSVNTGDFTAELSWFLILDGGIKFALGRISLPSVLKEECNAIWIKWIDELIIDRQEASDRIQKLEAKVKDLQQQRAEVLKEHDVWVKEKREKVEKTIYKKFKEVLNAKKGKIRDLMKANKELAMRIATSEEALKVAASRAIDASNTVEHEGVDRALHPNRFNEAGSHLAESGESSSDTSVDAIVGRPAKRKRGEDGSHDARQQRTRQSTSSTTAPSHGEQLTVTAQKGEADKVISAISLDDSDDTDEGPPALLGNLGLPDLRGNVYRTTSRRLARPVMPSAEAGKPPAAVFRTPTAIEGRQSRTDRRTGSRAPSNLSEQDSPESLLRKI